MFMGLRQGRQGQTVTTNEFPCQFCLVGEGAVEVEALPVLEAEVDRH
jgi:hypothetical protein